MAYITRELERKFLKMNTFFKAILVTGARQQSYLCIFRQCNGTRTCANRSCAFLPTYKPPILIDEIQKAPALFEQIKIICDESDEKGLIWLTGSQQYNMMKQVRETLAGRIGILELYRIKL